MNPVNVRSGESRSQGTRLTRRTAVHQTGVALTAGLLLGRSASGASAMTATPTAAPDTTLAGMLGQMLGDSEFTGQFLRALDVVIAGGADIGECFMTVPLIAPGDHDSWHDAWRKTADRAFAAAERSEAAGHLVSAREGYLRAVTYYRTSGIFLYRPPLTTGLSTPSGVSRMPSVASPRSPTGRSRRSRFPTRTRPCPATSFSPTRKSPASTTRPAPPLFAQRVSDWLDETLAAIP
jgi:hypothetical protein